MREPKEKSIWVNLALAIVATPITAIVFLVIITLIGAIDDAVTKIQSTGRWWVILIIAYIPSLIYVFYEPKFRRSREREKVVNGLILYWKQQLVQKKEPHPPGDEIKVIRDMIRDRVEVWACSDPELWSRFFSNERYPEYLFGIVDNLMAHWKELKMKYELHDKS